MFVCQKVFSTTRQEREWEKEKSAGAHFLRARYGVSKAAVCLEGVFTNTAQG